MRWRRKRRKVRRMTMRRGRSSEDGERERDGRRKRRLERKIIMERGRDRECGGE